MRVYFANNVFIYMKKETVSQSLLEKYEAIMSPRSKPYQWGQRKGKKHPILISLKL